MADLLRPWPDIILCPYNREAGDADALIKLVGWYSARREIEIFFNALMNARRLEALQLSQMERVEKTLAWHMVVSTAHARGQNVSGAKRVAIVRG